MRDGLEVKPNERVEFILDGAFRVEVFVHRIDDARWMITFTDREDGPRAYEIRHDPTLPLDAWSVHPPHIAREWATFPSWEAALRFASILH
jgi:hypothetical protein